MFIFRIMSDMFVRMETGSSGSPDKAVEIMSEYVQRQRVCVRNVKHERTTAQEKNGQIIAKGKINYRDFRWLWPMYRGRGGAIYIVPAKPCSPEPFLKSWINLLRGEGAVIDE